MGWYSSQCQAIASQSNQSLSGFLMRDHCDTTPEAQQFQIQLLRQKSPAQRVALALQLSSDVIQASKRAIARAHPELTSRQVEHQFIELHYGVELANAVKSHDRMLPDGQ